MKFKNSEKWAFITMGGMALNIALMANGIETMPHMWVKEVYQDPMLGASIGGMTGIALGGLAGAAYIVTQETVKSSISLLRNKFSKNNNSNNLSI